MIFTDLRLTLLLYWYQFSLIFFTISPANILHLVQVFSNKITTEKQS